MLGLLYIPTRLSAGFQNWNLVIFDLEYFELNKNNIRRNDMADKIKVSDAMASKIKLKIVHKMIGCWMILLSTLLKVAIIV